MSHVEAHAAFTRLLHGRVQAIGAVEQAAALRGVDVGEDVAGPQQLDDPMGRLSRLVAPGLPDVDHQPRADLVR